MTDKRQDLCDVILLRDANMAGVLLQNNPESRLRHSDPFYVHSRA